MNSVHRQWIKPVLRGERGTEGEKWTGEARAVAAEKADSILTRSVAVCDPSVASLPPCSPMQVTEVSGRGEKQERHGIASWIMDTRSLVV